MRSSHNFKVSASQGAQKAPGGVQASGSSQQNLRINFQNTNGIDNPNDANGGINNVNSAMLIQNTHVPSQFNTQNQKSIFKKNNKNQINLFNKNK